MLQKIKLELFDNKLYTVNSVQDINVKFMFIDFPSLSSQSSPNQYSVFQPNLFTKSFQLNRLDIPISISNSNHHQFNITEILYRNIYNEINKEYFKVITQLGEKNRINLPMNNLDINISKIKSKYQDDEDKISKAIINKFQLSGNFIATEGRIGPNQWIVSNYKTYKYILNYIETDHISFDDNNNIVIGKPFIIDDNIDDGIILTGRKNDIQSPGVHCFILCDKDNNIIINEINSFDIFSKIYSINFAIDSTGLNPEKQFLKINTKTIGYYRMKKLQKIKEIYGS